jgi:RNase P/RNase MRP subunit p30
MEFDVVMPKNNEQELIDMAYKLGIKKVYFLYEKSEELDKELKIETKVTFEKALLVNDQRFKIPKNHEVFGPAKRSFFESSKMSFLIDFQDQKGHDYLHQRKGGIDQVMVSLAQKKKKTLLFYLKNIKNPQVMGRVMQNINISKKKSLNLGLVSLANTPFEMSSRKDVEALERIMGLK